MPHNAIFNSSGSELWIGQTDSVLSQILVYNMIDWSLQNTIIVGKGLSEVTFSNDGTKGFACNTLDSTVTVIDSSSKIAQNTLSVGTGPVGVI